MSRQHMHDDSGNENLTDSMQMYQWGVDKGKPATGEIGVQPEWFYKGNGTILRAHGEMLEIPSYANDGGEEPEIAGVYLVDRSGKPRRIGFTTGNEFSDHIMEKKNYLYLAPSKLRNCSIGPELVLGTDFIDIAGTVSVIENGKEKWSSGIKTGENNMSHSLQNIEHHHFKYESHRTPLQAHIHFLGADSFSFGNNIQLQDGNIMQISWNGFGRALQNELRVSGASEGLAKVQPL